MCRPDRLRLVAPLTHIYLSETDRSFRAISFLSFCPPSPLVSPRALAAAHPSTAFWPLVSCLCLCLVHCLLLMLNPYYLLLLLANNAACKTKQKERRPHFSAGDRCEGNRRKRLLLLGTERTVVLLAAFQVRWAGGANKFGNGGDYIRPSDVLIQRTNNKTTNIDIEKTKLLYQQSVRLLVWRRVQSGGGPAISGQPEPDRDRSILVRIDPTDIQRRVLRCALLILPFVGSAAPVPDRHTRQ